MNPTGTVTHAVRRAAAAQQALGAAKRAERSAERSAERAPAAAGIQSEAVLRSALEHLAEPVFLFEPVFDDQRIVDLRLVETNPAGREATRTSCPPGVLASDLYVAPLLAVAAAQRTWDGLTDEPYEVVRPAADGSGRDSVYRITTLWPGLPHRSPGPHRRARRRPRARWPPRLALTLSRGT